MKLLNNQTVEKTPDFLKSDQFPTILMVYPPVHFSGEGVMSNSKCKPMDTHTSAFISVGLNTQTINQIIILWVKIDRWTLNLKSTSGNSDIATGNKIIVIVTSSIHNHKPTKNIRPERKCPKPFMMWSTLECNNNLQYPFYNIYYIFFFLIPFLYKTQK